MSHAPVFTHPTAPTWRDIPQAASPRPVNRTGRRRLIFSALRFWSFAGLVAASLLFGYFAVRVWRDNPGGLAGPAESAPLREIVARSDGVLDLAWVQRTLSITPGVGLMTLDLPALQDRLVASGQVRVAVVSRRLPDVLSVVLEERSPVLRIMTQGGDGSQAALFVARDGAVFTGEGYAPDLVNALPWLDGVALVRDISGRGFAPIPGLAAVSDLLGTARASAPPLARTFHSVSLSRFERDGLIIVRTPEVAEILFGAQSELGYFQQLARLDYILDEFRSQASPPALRSINLALGGRQVPVAFEPAAPPAARGARPTPAAERPAARPTPSTLTFFRPQPLPVPNRSRDL